MESSKCTILIVDDEELIRSLYYYVTLKMKNQYFQLLLFSSEIEWRLKSQ
jgi:hypothetical protein